MNNKFTGNVVEFHILQSFPVSCLNRDDVGSPKSAIVGGTERARVSSQCWKRAVRQELHKLGVKTACRTRYVTKAIAEQCEKLGATPEQALACGETAAKVFTKKVEKETKISDTLLFISETECKKLAEFFQSKEFSVTHRTDDDEKKSKKGNSDIDKKLKTELSNICKRAINPVQDGLDIALFGRMVASAPDLNLEAAASFSHAISTHHVMNEVDFFTAVDDRRNDNDNEFDPEEENNSQGSAHMGLLEFNSATYYRYISLDLGQLAENLRSDDLDEALEAFTKALFLAVPEARQTTMSARCPWEYAVATVRKGQRLQLPFNTAVRASGGKSLLEASRTELDAQLGNLEKMYGSLFGLSKRMEMEIGGGTSIDDLVAGLKQAVAQI